MADVKVFTDLDIELAHNNRPAFKTLNLGWDLETGSVAVNYTLVEEVPVTEQPA